MNESNNTLNENQIKFIEKCLWELWSKLNLDKPSNWESLVNFVVDDILETTNVFHSGDIEISFRRFFETITYDKS